MAERRAPATLPAGASPVPTPSAIQGLRGLHNLGNTCFMNCILQIFMHCPPVARLFLADCHNRFECMAQQLDGDRRSCLACELDRCFSQCFSGRDTPFSPNCFLHAMWVNAEHFAGYEQQDAHEFLIALLAGVCAGMREMQPRHPPLGRAGADAGPGGFVAKRARLPSTAAAATELLGVFSGQLRSEVTCGVCGVTSTKHEDFSDISLNLAPPAQADRRQSLLTCLRSFTREEQLGTTERCWCEQCDALQDSSKRLSIEKLPNVLCFHLKRFEHGAGQGSKIDAFVEFPLHSLNMYDHSSAHLCEQARDEPPAQPPPEYLYDLFGVAVHHGSIQNGHYTAFVRRHASWFHCDDAVVTPATPQTVRGCQGYLLFYIRKKLL